MIKVSVNLPIGPDSENRWMMEWGCEPVFFSMESVKRLFEDNPDEKDFRFDINCDGGYVDEGLAIYDCIRTSGKNIYCNIEGGCHSMAIVLLLAAPKENRTANPNCRALIHNVRTMPYGDMTAEQMEKAADELRMQEGAILDIYADRTGMDKDILQGIMNEEKVRTASELLEWGFIGSVNSYNTNLKKTAEKPIINKQNSKKNMAKNLKELLEDAKNVISRSMNLLSAAVNFDHTDADGNVLFSTDAEDDTLEVGMGATPDGTYTLAAATSQYPEGTVVVIADGAITEINEPAADPEPEPDEEVENLRAENAQLRAQLEESTNLLRELQASISTNYKPTNAKRVNPAKKSVSSDAVDHKEEMRAKLGLKTKED